MEIKKVFVEDENNNGIIIDGSNLSTVVKEEILDACSRWKNMFLFGYPHHEEKRIISAEAGIRYEHWAESPGVCITYLPKQLENGDLLISCLFSDTTSRPHSKDEKALLISLFQQHVIEEIEKITTV